MKRPPVVHVYRHTSGQLWVSAPKDIYSEAVYLGPYVPKASGPPPAIVIHDEARIWALEAEIAKLKAADTRGEVVVLRAELARLRRLADVGAKNAHTTRDARGVVFCTICHKSGLGIGITAPIHTATCDAAIHLGLERESET